MSQSISESSLPPVVLEAVNKVPTCLSTDVARDFDKRHREVLRGIRILLSDIPEDFSGRNFALANYTDEQGKPRPMYRLTRDAFTLVVMGFTGKKALAWKIRYIQAFNAMAEKLSDLCYRERLAQYAGQFEAARKLLGDEMCARINEVLMMRDVKIPVKQIARLSGVSTSTVSRWTKKYGWLERPLSLNCYLSGITLYEVERRRSVQQGSLLTLTGRA